LADRDLVKPLHDRLNKLFAGIYLETKVTSLADAGNAIEVGFEDATVAAAKVQPRAGFCRSAAQ